MRNGIKYLLVAALAVWFYHAGRVDLSTGAVASARAVAQADFAWTEKNDRAFVLELPSDMIVPSGSVADYLAQARRTTSHPVIKLSGHKTVFSRFFRSMRLEGQAREILTRHADFQRSTDLPLEFVFRLRRILI